MRRPALRVAVALVTALAGAFGALPSPARASESIPRAIGVFITQRGQQYFTQNLQDMLDRNGVSLDQGGFDAWDYQAADPISLDNLPVQFQSYSGTLGQLRDVLKRWLRGFDLQDPKFSIHVSNIQFNGSFQRLALSVSQEGTRQYAGGRGAVLLFEAEIPSVRIEAESLRASDLDNPFLGTFGADKLAVSLLQGGEPLRIQAPILVQVTPSGTVDFRVMAFQTNLNEAHLDLGFRRPMILPRVRVIVNGHAMTLNQNHVEQELLEFKPRILEMIQKYLSEFSETKVPDALNQLITERIPNPFSDVNEMNPPGVDRVGPGDKYRWGVRPEQIDVSPRWVHFGLSAFVDDPRVAGGGGTVSRRMTSALPRLDLVDPSTYDVALSINEDLVNRVLGLGFNRGYNTDITLNDGSKLHMVAPPEFRFDATSARDRGKLHLKVSQQVDGIRSLVVHNPLTFEMDVDARLVHAPNGDLSVTMNGIEVDSLRLDPGSVRASPGSYVWGQVADAVRDKLEASSLDLASHERVLVEKLPIPSQVVGIPIRVKDFQSDRNGYLVLYLEYDLRR